MKNIRKIKIKSYNSVSGKLVPISFDKKFPFSIKRIFFLHGKKNKIRGEHAHKKCSQFFFSIHGKVILNIKTPNSNKKIVLKSSSNTGILVPPKYWCGVKFINKDSILMVACDKYYDFDDYLGTFNEYKKYLKKL